ncbi:MAG TPA: hypothetical protein VEI46_07965 [Thermodesulfovibrionales bacterium]|nr:hypothetical protein [Thermodesulfovibrionales bacterium]HXX81470.1 hypothetical protein [Thermodesulfovibrionales bacterium]
MEAAKIYGLCLERITHQIIGAKQRVHGGQQHNGLILLESYNTGDIEDIIDILELYDIEARTHEALKEKLEDLAYTISALMREVLFFDYTEEDHMGLYLSLKGNLEHELHDNIDADAVAAAV